METVSQAYWIEGTSSFIEIFSSAKKEYFSGDSSSGGKAMFLAEKWFSKCCLSFSLEMHFLLPPFSTVNFFARENSFSTCLASAALFISSANSL